MASEKGSYMLQCATSSAKTAVIKAPEGMRITCTEKKSTVSVGTECEITCDTGGPNYSSVMCKAAGWRPTNEIECEGVNPGVIVGVLIAGIAAVVLIAIGYAKYRQHKKKKDGRNFKVQTGKLTNSSSNRSRPGKVIGPPTADDKPKTANFVGSDADSSRTRNSSRKSKPPSYSDLDAGDRSNGVVTKQNSGNHEGPEVPPHDKSRRSHHRKQHGSQQQHGSQHGNHQQHGYHQNYQQGYQYADAQAGYNNQAYYPQGHVGYGYPPQDQSVGYPAMAHPQAYPENRDYHRQYNVPT